MKKENLKFGLMVISARCYALEMVLIEKGICDANMLTKEFEKEFENIKTRIGPKTTIDEEKPDTLLDDDDN